MKEDKPDIRTYKQKGHIVSSLIKTLGELISKDGLTIHQITNSKFITESFMQRGWKMPSEATVSKMLIEESKKVEIKIRDEIAVLLKNHVRFSVVMDEWTSISSKRFMSILLTHKSGHLNLGVVLLNGNATAQMLTQTLISHLAIFGINIETHVVAITSDGAAVMKKLQQGLPCETQFCQAHGIHLAVTDIFVSKKPFPIEWMDEYDDEEAARIHQVNLKCTFNKIFK